MPSRDGPKGLTLLSPEELAATSTEQQYLLALDSTGIVEKRPPATLERAFVSWRNSGLVAPGLESPLDAVAPQHHGVIVASYLTAVEHGFGACTVETAMGATTLLTFWNRLEEADCVLVVVTPVESGADSEAALPTLKPLRCMQRLSVFGITEYIDDATTAMLGWGPEVIGVSRLNYNHPDDIKQGMRTWTALVANPGHELMERGRIRLADGSYRWFDSRVRNCLHTDGYIEVEMIDVDEHVVQEANPHTHVAVADALAALVTDGVAVLDHHNFLVAINERFCELTGAAIDDDRRRLVFPPTPVFKHLAALIAQVRGDVDDVDLRSEVSLPVEVSQIENPDSSAEPLVLLIVKADSATAVLPKGFSQHTLDRIISALAVSDATGLGYIEVAESCGVSEVTARRYLAYLDSRQMVEVSQDYGSPGRPRKRFRLV